MIGKIDTDAISDRLWLLYLLKTYYDAGITEYIDLFDGSVIDEDSFYEYIWEALEYVAPLAEQVPVMDEDGEEMDDAEEYRWHFGSDEMKRCYRLAMLIHRLEGGSPDNNPRIDRMNREIEDMRFFDSYCFDYGIHYDKKDAYLDVVWDCYFTCELPLCIWIVKAMEAYKTFRAELEGELKIALRKRRIHRVERSAA